jgi:hypothetical protein
VLLTGFQAKALRIVYELIPLKIDALQSILTKYKAIPCDDPVFTAQGAECNKSVMALMQPIKVEIHDLLSYADPLRMWVSLNIPRIQDQKGMAVSVKEDLVEMLHSGKVSAMGLLESMCKYQSVFFLQSIFQHSGSCTVLLLTSVLRVCHCPVWDEASSSAK